MKPYRILHLEDSSDDCIVVQRLLKKSALPFTYLHVNNEAAYMEALGGYCPDVILCDHSLPQFNSTMAFDIYQQAQLDIPFLLVTGTVSEEFAVDMMKRGVDDYLLKTNLQRLPVAIEHALEARQSRGMIARMHNDLQKSESKLRAIFEHSGIGLVLLDLNATVLALNQEAAGIFCQALNRTIDLNESMELLLPALGIKSFDQDRAALVAGGSLQYETSFAVTPNEMLFCKIVFNPVRSEDGTVAGICGVFDNVTEQRKASEAVLKAMERYDILSRATSDTIWDCDLTNDTIVYNEGITKMFGYHKYEVTNLLDWWKQHLHPDDLPGVLRIMEECFDTSCQNMHLTYRFRCNNGGYKFIYDRGFILFDDTGKAYRMIGAMQDITYQKTEDIRVAREILRAQEQERLQIGLELHDNINQILVGSLISLDMVKTKIAEEEKAIGFIKKTHAHIESAISEIRKLSHELAPDTFDNQSLKLAFERLLGNLSEGNRFAVSMHFDNFSHVCIVNELQKNIYRILQEQVKNIVQHSGASQIEVSLTLENNGVKLRIADNGKGFDIKDAAPGGIGLNNIKRRAESFNGKWNILSEVGKGSELVVEIPL